MKPREPFSTLHKTTSSRRTLASTASFKACPMRILPVHQTFSSIPATRLLSSATIIISQRTLLLARDWFLQRDDFIATLGHSKQPSTNVEDCHTLLTDDGHTSLRGSRVNRGDQNRTLFVMRREGENKRKKERKNEIKWKNEPLLHQNNEGIQTHNDQPLHHEAHSLHQQFAFSAQPWLNHGKH